MVFRIGYDEFVAMLTGAIEQIRRRHSFLSELDAATGDGDHGTTMLRAANKLEQVISAGPAGDLKGLLQGAGWALLAIDGGATGPLFGSFLLGMSRFAEGKSELDADALAGMFEAGLTALRRQTKALPGDKTLLDALVPAIDVLRRSAGDGKGVLAALEEAAAAADAGAAATKSMVARAGRAKHQGERTVGHQDPGATSVALLLQGYYEGLQKRSEVS
jgi:dihydroxyacetone kinase-like protein